MPRSVDRALRLLDLVAHNEPLALAELAGGSGLAPSTAHRLLASLIGSGFVDQDPDSRKYGAGPGLLGLASAAEQQLSRLRIAALPRMTELAATCGETVYLNTLDGAHVVFADQALAPESAGAEVTVGTRVLAHATAAGKAMIALGGEPLLEPLLRSGLTRFTPMTITDPTRLRRELTLARRRGWATEIDEHTTGAACVAAPIRLGPSAPRAALSISGPSSRLRAGALPSLGRLLEATGGSIVAALSAARCPR